MSGFKIKSTIFMGRTDITGCVGEITIKQKQITVLTPIGTVLPFAGSTSPKEYLICDGSAYSRDDYYDLFLVIGTTYGDGDGSTTFNVPDLRGKVVVGLNAADDDFDSLNANGGEKTHTLTIPEMPIHHHTGTTDAAGVHNHGITDPGHTHSYFNQPNTVNPAISLTTTDVADNINVNQTTGSSTTGITINNAGSHVHTFTSNDTGGSQPHNNLQPFRVLNYIIKFI